MRPQVRRLNDGGNAHGDDGHAQRCFVHSLAVIPHAAAGNEACVPQLHRGAETAAVAGGERVDGDDGGGLHRGNCPLQQLHGLHACLCQHPCGQGGNRGKVAELAWQALHHVAGDEEIFQRQRPDGIGGHGAVTQPRHQYAAAQVCGQKGGDLVGNAPTGAGKEALLAAEVRAQVDGGVMPHRLADGPAAVGVGDVDGGDGKALPPRFFDGDAVERRKIFLIFQIFHGFQRQVRPRDGHIYPLPP